MAPTISTALVLVLLAAPSATAAQSSGAMQSDVDRLVQAAGALTRTWPSQPAPPVPEVALVASHGKAVVPLLIDLLSDDPSAERDRRRWSVQQQVTLTLARIYAESAHCGRSYCDGDPPERIARIKEGWLRVIAADREMQALSWRELLDRFKAETLFFQQFEIAKALAATKNSAVIAELEAWLTHDDRQVRGNVAFVLGRLGDPRGFETIAGILADRSPRPVGPGRNGAKWTLEAQIVADRYYAAHLLGDLKDPRGVDLLIPLLNDGDVGDIAPWSLAEIGDRRAIAPLIAQTERADSSLRVLAILALERLNAREALPRLRQLVQDDKRSNLGERSMVAQAAEHAIAVLSR